MDHFVRQGAVLHAEDVALTDIAQRFGTPTYVYSQATLARHVDVLRRGIGSLPHLLCYAVKACSNIAILETLHGLGCGFDAVSVGELWRVRRAGGDMRRTIVSGVGKTDDEIAAALKAQVLYVCVESSEELDAVAHIAAQTGVRAPVSVRVNPDVDAKTHPYISTGLKQNKFGVPIGTAMALYERGRRHASLEMVGVTCHIGSQITTLAPFIDAATRLAALAAQLKAANLPLRHVGMGGGLGVPYHDETPPDPATYGQALGNILAPLGLEVILEPGRVIVGNAAVLLSRVVRVKQGAERTFVLLDAGMNDLLRPALYDAFHDIEPVVADADAPLLPVDVVGPVCESADTFAKQRPLQPLQPGDLVALRTAGAYGMVMASTYNGRPRPAEVLCQGASAQLIRQRDSIVDLWRGERRCDGSPVDDSPLDW